MADKFKEAIQVKKENHLHQQLAACVLLRQQLAVCVFTSATCCMCVVVMKGDKKNYRGKPFQPVRYGDY